MSGEKVSGKWDGFATWLEAEVVVCGGGTAGAFAAIAAAREGAGVLLIEAIERRPAQRAGEQAETEGSRALRTGAA